MRPVPGYPHRNLPDVRVEPEQTPGSIPPGGVQVRGRGWSATIPAVLVASLVSVVAPRMWPTRGEVQTEATELGIQRMALEDERFREEMRRELAVLNQRLERLETRISVLEIHASKP